MTAPLPPDVADKLAKVCGLLTSSHDGERAAAAQKASELLQSLGITWRELVEMAAAPARPSKRNDGAERAPAEWAAIIAEVIEDPPELRGREADFLRNMLSSTRAGRMPSEKQAEWLEGIIARRRP